jgi:hypothetical protein
MIKRISLVEKQTNNMTDYYKIIGKNNGNFPYHLGVNSLAETGETFNAKPVCAAGGLYYTTVKFIFEYLNYGDRVCRVQIPADAHVVQVENKFKADKIEIMEIVPLDVEGLKWMLERGADIHACDDSALRWSAQYGHLEVVRLLLERGADIHADDDLALRWSAHNGHLEVVRLLLECGADVHADNDFALRWSGDPEIIALLKQYQ